MSSITLFTIPTSALASSLCPFLSSDSLISLRTTCKNAYNFIHSEQESETIWKNALSRDFSIQNDNILISLRIAPSDKLKSSGEISIFGYPATEAVFTASSVFESWKYWRKASLIYYSGGNDDDVPPAKRCLCGPFFLRAAAFWSTILRWCAKSGDMANQIPITFKRGLRHCNWPESLKPDEDKGLLAVQAIYAFCGGQHIEDTPRFQYSLFGGYCAYDYYSITSLRSPGRLEISGDSYAIVAMCHLSPESNTVKAFGVCIDSGAFYYITHYGRVAAVNTDNENGDSSSEINDSAMVWFEEYARRLDSGVYRVGQMAGLREYIGSYDNKAIVLYPRLSGRHPLQEENGAVPVVSRAVTRGVEVIASAVFTPQCAAVGLGFIYSIRIRLLTPDDGDEYVPKSERGFVTCQLQSRHWKITNSVSGQTEHVNGDGVIGMFPLLNEGGYKENGVDYDGTFVYQSCTGPMKGSFAGSMQFFPGTRSSPTGDAFDVELKPFVLDTSPNLLY